MTRLRVRRLTTPAEFSFGEALSAISTWSKGEEVALVSKNDEKATFLPLVRAMGRELLMSKQS